MLSLIITLIVIGVLLYLVETIIPMDAAIRQVIRVVVLICVIIYLLGIFGVLSVDLPVPRLR